MKILFAMDINLSWVCGCNHFAQRLAFSLRENGHDVNIIASSDSLTNSKNIIENVTIYGIRSYPIRIIPGLRICFLPFYSKRIEKIIDNFKPDVIHCQNHFALSRAVLKVAKKRNIPIIATNHFMTENLIHFIPFLSVIGSTICKFAWRDFARIYKKMDIITTPTKIAASLIQPYFKKQVVPISCGVNLKQFKPEQDVSYLKKRYAIPEKLILLSVGRLDKEKKLEHLIRATASALKQTEFHLVIAGKGNEKQRLLKLAIDLGIENSITFTGFVPNEDLPKLYCLADCFVITSTAELQSIVTMEAMASALPILAANAVALPELVQHGENGFLFEPGNLLELTEKIITIFNDANLRKNMRKKSLEFIDAHDMEKTISKFQDIYTAVSAK